MKSVFLLTLVAFLVAAQDANLKRFLGEDGNYFTKYDDIDLDDILQNERLYTNYLKCFTNQGKCTKEGLDLKAVIPDALKTKCAKCSDKQKAGIEKVLRFVLKTHPEHFTEVEKIWDPEGVYRELWADFTKSKGIQLPPRAS